jgi:glucan phosphorylase
MEATGRDFWTARQDVAQSTVFTTHTPVDAGHDRFPPELVDEHLEPLRDRWGCRASSSWAWAASAPRIAPRRCA